MMQMRCAWQELMSILPPWLRGEMGQFESEIIQEIRLRLDSYPEVVVSGSSQWLKRTVNNEDILFPVNAASRYSPWSAATVAKGYLTARGGHRIGLCGEAVIKNGVMTGIREVISINIRVARDLPGIADGIRIRDSVLIVGAPGSGKTTLLRDLIRRISNGGSHVSVVDERGELFPQGAFNLGRCTDVLTGCSKQEGIDSVLRSMGPSWIAVDEITEAGDCEALLHAGWCGVRLLATAHAGSLQDLRSREVYRPLMSSRLFPTVVVLKQDKTWTQERMDI